MAGAKFYGVYPDAGLENASQLLTSVFQSKTAGIIFGIALLASGQSSTLTGTYAGTDSIVYFMHDLTDFRSICYGGIFGLKNCSVEKKHDHAVRQ